MATTQYIGARYVPVFGRLGEDTIEWDNSATYEPLTVVLHQGNSYTSRQFVPAGVDIANGDYWAETGNYNAQIEQYRQDVQGMQQGIDGNAAAINAEASRAKGAEEANAAAITAEAERAKGAEEANAAAITAEAERAKGAEESNAAAITAEAERAKGAESELESRIENIDISKLHNATIVCIGDSYLEGYTPEGTVQSWGQFLKNELDADVTISALGGTGFSATMSGTNFTTLVTNAAKKLGAAKAAEVDYVIIGGGYNDRGNSASDELSDASICKNEILTQFPNATIAVFPMLFGNAGYDIKFATVTNAICEAFKGHLVFPNCWTWNYSKQANVASDTIHPNAKGQSVIAKSMITSLLGGDATVYSERFDYSPIYVYRILDELIIRGNNCSGTAGETLATMDISLKGAFALNTGLATRGGSYATSYYQVSGNKVSIFSGNVDSNGYFSIVTTLTT